MRFTATFITLIALLVSGCSVMPKSSFNAKEELNKLKGPEIGTVEASIRDQADNAATAGDFKRAASLYKQLFDKFPENKDFAVTYADYLRRSGDTDSSLRVVDSVLKKDPEHLAALETKGLCLMQAGEFVEAGKVLDGVLKKDSKRWRTLNAIGILFTIKNLSNEAIAYYKAALEISTDNPSVLNNLALTYAIDHRYDHSIETLQRAHRHVATGSKEAKHIDLNLALVYAISGDLENAEQTASPHLSKAGLYNNMGFYSYLSKNTDLAKSYLNMALMQSPTYYERAWKNLNAISGDSDSEPQTNTLRNSLGTISPEEISAKKTTPAPVPTQTKSLVAHSKSPVVVAPVVSTPTVSSAEPSAPSTSAASPFQPAIKPAVAEPAAKAEESKPVASPFSAPALR